MLFRVTRSFMPVIAGLLLLGLTPSMASASKELTLSIPQTGYFEEGVIASLDVPSELEGATCDVTATAENNESVRRGTDLTVESNGSSVVLRNVEREEGATTTVAAGSLVLGTEITVSVTFGPEPAFSGGMTITAVCEPLEEEPEPSPTDEPNPPGNGNPPNEHDNPKPDNPQGTADHGTDRSKLEKRQDRYGGTASTGFNETQRVLFGVMLILVGLAMAALFKAKQAATN